MFVRQLIGRQAGQIIDLPYHAAEACLAQGTVERVTDEEIAAAGLEQPETAPPVGLSITMPDGFETLARSDGLGFDLHRSPVERNEAGEVIGEPLNAEPLHNMMAARDAALLLVQSPAPVEIPEGWEDLKAEPMKALAVALGAQPEPATKADAAAFIEAEIARRAAEAEAVAARLAAEAGQGGGGQG